VPVRDSTGAARVPYTTLFRSRLALTEVYEVATFYHHFEVVKEGEMAPPALTVRVCDSIACELAGAHELLELNLGPGVRVIPAPRSEERRVGKECGSSCSTERE